MKLWVPVPETGIFSNIVVIAFTDEFETPCGFKTEEECNNWIDSHKDSFTETERKGNVIPSCIDSDDYAFEFKYI